MIDGEWHGCSRLAEAGLDQPLTKFEELAPRLETGDLWLYRGTLCPVSSGTFVRPFTGSPWSHIGMVLRRQSGIELIEITTTPNRGLVNPLATVLEYEKNSNRGAAIVLARPLAFTLKGVNGSIADEVVAARNRILTRAHRGFPANYDFLEILRILSILVLGGLARRWRYVPILGRTLARYPRRHLAKIEHARTAAAAHAPARATRQEAYTCSELVAELLLECDLFKGMFTLDPQSDDFVSPATIAERVPLVVLGRLQ